MFNFIDKWIEKKLKKRFHKQRHIIIEKALADFSKKNHPGAQQLQKLREMLEAEADRIYAVVDRSILRERIKRAKYTFWLTAVTSLVIVSIFTVLTSGIALPLLIPVLTAFVAWLVALVTIPIGYNERIKGAMDSTIQTFLRLQQSVPEISENKEELNQIKEIIKNLSIKVDNLSHDIESLIKIQQENKGRVPVTGEENTFKMWHTLKKDLDQFSQAELGVCAGHINFSRNR